MIEATGTLRQQAVVAGLRTIRICFAGLQKEKNENRQSGYEMKRTKVGPDTIQRQAYIFTTLPLLVFPSFRQVIFKK